MTPALDPCSYLTWLAPAYVRAHEAEQAAATLRRAHELADCVSSSRPAARIGVVAKQLQRHRDVAEVAEVLALVGA